ncbi:MAG: type II toxin-antitoxin system Phd/YefM family antitoxin [Oscillospiraceae bacterium]|nr:type II toxin-antitoxin system Phd/YefM family antitoxin [Oscillospiraceae bacterium]
MIAANYTSFRTNLKSFCDRATDDHETVIVTRKNDKNVVVISLEDYNQIMKAIRNHEYLTMIDTSIAQLEAGQGHVHELIEADDE